MSGLESGIVEDFTYDPTALVEISDILGKL